MTSLLQIHSVRLRLGLLVALLVTGFMILNIWDAARIEPAMRQAHQARLHDLVDSAVTVARTFQEKVARGEMDDAAAQAGARSVIAGMRHGDAEYFWINDLKGQVLMHPVKPDLETTDTTKVLDATGEPIFQTFARTVREHGAGTVEYLWPRPGASEPVRKMSYVRGFAPWGWVIGTGVYIDDVHAAFVRDVSDRAIILMIVLAIASVLAWRVAGSVTGPLLALAEATDRIGRADFATEVPALDRRDELGTLARSIAVLRDEAKAADALRTEKEKELAAREEAARLQVHLVEEFDAKVVDVMNRLIAATASLESNAGGLSAIAERTGTQSAAAAEAGGQADVNVQLVAAAAEELAASSLEIASQMSHASTVARGAKDEVAAAERIMVELSDSAGKISDVVALINSIASQTNLLALNATIEAARAGESGKGFAVVAGEVKQLANQTARATDEISAQIATVQDRTMWAAASIEKVADTIRRLDDTAASIAAAAGQQGDATKEISGNIHSVNERTMEVTRNVTGVSDGARETSDRAQTLFGAARDLLNEAESMRAIIDGFLLRLQAGGATLAWGPGWLTGHPVIDADHEKLVQYVNELNTAMTEGHGHDVAAAVLTKLVAYTREHFRREEKIWHEGGLATLTEHEATHAKLVHAVEGFQADFLAGKATLTAELMSFLRDWLVNHVFKTDKAGVKAIMAARRMAA